MRIASFLPSTAPYFSNFARSRLASTRTIELVCGSKDSSRSKTSSAIAYSFSAAPRPASVSSTTYRRKFCKRADCAKSALARIFSICAVTWSARGSHDRPVLPAGPESGSLMGKTAWLEGLTLIITLK
jgi:hypothetical protein